MYDAGLNTFLSIPYRIFSAMFLIEIIAIYLI